MAGGSKIFLQLSKNCSKQVPCFNKEMHVVLEWHLRKKPRAAQGGQNALRVQGQWCLHAMCANKRENTTKCASPHLYPFFFFFRLMMKTAFSCSVTKESPRLGRRGVL
jgi:hypothetical protein